MIKAGIVGGTGYTAGEMIRLLLNHPNIDIEFVYSTSKSGEPITAVHGDLLGETDLKFSQTLSPDIDILFLCMGHGNSSDFLKSHEVSSTTKIIDLSRDFRSKANSTFKHRAYTYGLPELDKGTIRSAENIANPGCFATAIQLALLPFVQASLFQKGNDVHTHGITGSTGAGSSLSGTSHFSWRNNNVSVYKALKHQHIGEIQEQLHHLNSSFESKLNFIPVRGNFTRGIFISAYTPCNASLDEVTAAYQKYYKKSPFVHLSDDPLHLKQVVNTNKCLLHLEKQEGQLIITSIIDNLLKGAAGQAVQNMNLMFGFDEHAGLQLKPTHF